MCNSLPIECQLPAGFLDPEQRAGFWVSEKLKKIWAIELDLLQQFQMICHKHGIKYQVFAGTLLGAVRHKGFIPWDDDLDVAMTRDEYEKFIRVAPLELKQPYFLQTALSDRLYFFGYARLRNSLTTGAISWFANAEYNNGIYIDIYVLDGRPKTAFQNFIQKKLLWVVSKLLLASCDHRNEAFSHRLCYGCLKPFASLIKYESRVQLYNCVAKMYNKQPEYLTQVTHGDWNYKYRIAVDAMDEFQMLDFEWMKVPVPKAYDSVLTQIYGDYMTMPPSEDRGKWHESLVHFEPDVPYMEFLGR